ncbi:MAG: SRPBCC family protein [Mycobacteriales bacterium]
MVERTRAQIHIDAPATEVLAVIADFAAYPQWADGVKAAEVVETGADGRPARVRFRVDAGPVKDTFTLGYDWHGQEGVSWVLVDGQMQRSQDGHYRLRPDGAGTEVTYELSVELAVPMPGMLKRRGEKRIVATALSGLKARVESARR